MDSSRPTLGPKSEDLGTRMSQSRPVSKLPSAKQRMVAVSSSTQIETNIYYHPLTSLDSKTGKWTTSFYWTYISSHLAEISGFELVFTVRCRDSDKAHTFPLDPIDLFDQLYRD